MSAAHMPSVLGAGVLAKSAHRAERGLGVLRDHAGRVLDRLQLNLRVIEARLDPEAKQWEQQVRAAVADGSIRSRLAGQRPPEEIVEHWRAATS